MAASVVGRLASSAAVVTLLPAAGVPPVAADERARALGSLVAVASEEPDSRPEPLPRDDAGRRGRRTVRAPIADPWSVGVRVLWRSLGGGGGAGLRPTAVGDSVPINAGCSAGGACSPGAVRYESAAPGASASGNSLAVQGVAIDAGRLITSGVEVGVGLDVTTHPGDALLSRSSGADTTFAFQRVSAGQSVAQVLAGERAMQMDLAGRLTYRFNTEASPSTTGARARPYAGVGVGLSRYFAGHQTLGLAGAGAGAASVALSGRVRRVGAPRAALCRRHGWLRDTRPVAGRRLPVPARRQSWRPSPRRLSLRHWYSVSVLTRPPGVLVSAGKRLAEDVVPPITGFVRRSEDPGRRRRPPACTGTDGRRSGRRLQRRRYSSLVHKAADRPRELCTGRGVDSRMATG